MKTYTKITKTEEPCLVIRHDDNADSPREWSNLGYFITRERNYRSPDKHLELERIIADTSLEADNLKEHIRLIKKAFRQSNPSEKILAIYPVTRYEHSAVSYSLGSASGFDYSTCGFYIVTDKTAKELGTPPSSFERVIKDELDTYTKYANGEVYGYTLHDTSGELIDSCWGFYSLDDIKVNLPKEYANEDLSEYVKY